MEIQKPHCSWVCWKPGVDHRTQWMLDLNILFALHTALLKAQCSVWLGAVRHGWSPITTVACIIRRSAFSCMCSPWCLCQRCWHAGAWHAGLCWLCLVEETTWKASQALWDRGEREIKVSPEKRGRVWQRVRADSSLDVYFKMLLYINIPIRHYKKEKGIHKNAS